MKDMYKVSGDDFEIKDFVDKMRHALEDMGFESAGKVHSIAGPRIYSYKKDEDEIALTFNDQAGNDAEASISATFDDDGFCELLGEVFKKVFSEKAQLFCNRMKNMENRTKIVKKMIEGIKNTTKID